MGTELTAKTRNKGGRPKGWDALRQHTKLREMVAEAQDVMAAAQIKAAQGSRYLVARNKKGGQFKPVTQDDIDAGLLGDEDVIVEVWDKQPSTPAFDSLMDRTLGQPKRSLEATVTHEVGPLVERILRGLGRADGK